MHKPIDYSGVRLGKLVAVDWIKSGGVRVWNCICDCGGKRQVPASAMRVTKSCGCDANQLAGSRWKKNGCAHGLSSHWLYNTWIGMMARCHSKSSRQYRDYGGRGIYVHKDWHNVAAFVTFMESIGAEKTPGFSIDRIDNNDGYYPWNIRLADRVCQANNTRRNMRMEYMGETLTIAEWAKKLGVPYGTLIARVKRGWSADRAIGGGMYSSQTARAAKAGAASEPAATLP